jgi:hypothetical protein
LGFGEEGTGARPPSRFQRSAAGVPPGTSRVGQLVGRTPQSACDAMRVAMESGNPEIAIGLYASTAVLTVHRLGRSPLSATQFRGPARIEQWLRTLMEGNPHVLHATVGEERFALAFECDFGGGRHRLTCACDTRDGQIARQEVSPAP